MKRNLIFFLIVFFFKSNSQSITLNESFVNDYLRTSQLLGNLETDLSFTKYPIDIGKNGVELGEFNLNSSYPDLISSKNNNFIFKILPVNYNIEYNSRHPYNRNNGSMIPNRGYQHIISPGI